LKKAERDERSAYCRSFDEFAASWSLVGVPRVAPLLCDGDRFLGHEPSQVVS
jgi:hypothetical protein